MILKALAAAACFAVAVLATSAAEARKVALVIGNDKYEHLESLQKAAADAAGYADVLHAKGFDQVILRQNLTRFQMDEAIAEFVGAVGPGDVAVFVYSGHGWSNGAQNFIIGTDAPATAGEDFLARLAIPVANGINGIVDEMARKGASLKVAIVDACRNNPFKPQTGGKSIGFGRGFNRLKEPPPDGTFMVFSAGAGQVALDRLSETDADPHGVFTRTFLPLLRTDLTLLDATKAAQERVFELAKAIGHDQLPAYYDEVKGKACLEGTCQGGPPPAAGGVPIPAGDPIAADYALAERIGTVAAWDAFLAKHADTSESFYVQLAQAARQKLASLDPGSVPFAAGPNPVADAPFDPGRAVAVAQIGHGYSINALALSPDGTMLASASFDNTAKLWDAATGHVLRTFRGHRAGVEDVAFSPDGKTLASASRDKTVRLWDLHSGQLLRTILTSDRVNTIAYSPDGKTIASGQHNDSVTLWDAATGQFLRMLEGHSIAIRTLAYSPDGRILLTGNDDLTVKLWDVDRGILLRTLDEHLGWISTVAFSPDGRLVASAGSGKEVRIWEAASGRKVHQLQGHTATVTAIEFSPDGARLASGSSDQTIRVWDVASGRTLQKIALPDQILSMVFAGDGRDLFVTTSNVIRRVDSSSGAEQDPFAASQPGATSGITFAPDGASILSAAYGDAPRLWDVLEPRVLRRFERRKGGVVTFSPDGATVVAGSEEGMPPGLWDARTGAGIATLKGHKGDFGETVFTPDGKIVVADNEMEVTIWDVAKSRLLRTIKESGSTGFAISPDGKSLALFGWEDTTIWNVASGRRLRTLKDLISLVTSGAYSPDGKSIALGTGDDYDFKVVLMDATSGRVLRAFEGFASFVLSTGFSRDGKRILASSGEQTKVWDVGTGRLLATLEADERGGATAFSPDGRLIATVDGPRLRLWSGEDYSLRATLIGLDGLDFIAEYPDGSYFASEGASASTIMVDGLHWMPATADSEAKHRRRTTSWQ